MPGFELIGKEEKEALLDIFETSNGVLFKHGFDALRNGRFRVREFQDAFASYIGSRHALALPSGTAAVKVALRALGVGPGDEVITQAFTFVATFEAIMDLGATPVVVNVDETLNMDPRQVEDRITSRTRAIMPVHMLGVAAEMDEIRKSADRRGIPVVEENCEALGAMYGGRFLGTVGDVAAFSFDFGKVITTGEGGMITTDDENVHALAAEYADHGHQNNPNFPRGRDTRRVWGFNFRMTELQAAVGLAQLAKLDFIRDRNRHNYHILQEALASVDGLEFRRIPEQCEPLFDTLIFYLPDAETADRFVSEMQEVGLGTKNLPDAYDWHFAGRWDHMCQELGLSKEELLETTSASAELLERAVSIPVMVKESEPDVKARGQKLRAIATRLL